MFVEGVACLSAHMVRRQRSHCSSASTATSPKPSSALLPTMKAQDWQFEPQDASAAEAERALVVELTHKQGGGKTHQRTESGVDP